MHERDFISWIRRQEQLDPKAFPLGPGDDCAIAKLGGEDLLVTCDQVLDGVHFRLAEHGAEAVGRKAMARALSDVAAMAAVPVAAVATVALPRGFTRQDAEALYRGRRSVSDVTNCPVIGGDLGVWDGPLAISMTVFARRAGVTGGVEPVLRSGARPGQAVCLTGRLGGSWRGRRHLEFLPRLAEGVALAMNYRVRAMIDISDGLATDLRHLCEASGLGAEIVAADVPIHNDARIGLNPADSAAALRRALTDGEDYELLFTLPSAWARKLVERQPLPVPVTRVGRIVKARGITLIHPDGRREELADAGWEHRTDG